MTHVELNGQDATRGGSNDAIGLAKRSAGVIGDAADLEREVGAIRDSERVRLVWFDRLGGNEG